MRSAKISFWPSSRPRKWSISPSKNCSLAARPISRKTTRRSSRPRKQIDPHKSPAEVMKSLSDDHPTADDLIPSVRRSVEAARRYLVDHGIVTVPSEVRPKIEETPPYARSGSFASMDTPGPYETRGDPGVLLRHAGRERLGCQTRSRAPAALQPAGRGHDQRPRGLSRPLPPVPLREAVPDQGAESCSIAAPTPRAGPTTASR